MFKSLLTFVITIFSLSVAAQNISQLNAEKENILAQIESSNELLEEYSQKKSDELINITILDDLIKQRRKLINIYNSEIKLYTNQITALSLRLDSLENEIFQLKSEYSKIIYQESLNMADNSELIYIFSAKSFNESYKRFLFLRQYSDYRRSQAARLSENIDKFNDIKSTIEDRRTKLTSLLADAKKEAASLERQLSERQQRLEDFATSETNLRQEIEIAQARARELEERIVVLIQEEAARKKKNDMALSADILKNKGKLPWPTTKHLVTSEYGEHPHPLLQSHVIRKTGIDFNVFDYVDVHPAQD